MAVPSTVDGAQSINVVNPVIAPVENALSKICKINDQPQNIIMKRNLIKNQKYMQTLKFHQQTQRNGRRGLAAEDGLRAIPGIVVDDPFEAIGDNGNGPPLEGTVQMAFLVALFSTIRVGQSKTRRSLRD